MSATTKEALLDALLEYPSPWFKEIKVDDGGGGEIPEILTNITYTTCPKACSGEIERSLRVLLFLPRLEGHLQGIERARKREDLRTNITRGLIRPRSRPARGVPIPEVELALARYQRDADIARAALAQLQVTDEVASFVLDWVMGNRSFLLKGIDLRRVSRKMP
jgi:hypothetical protein